MRDPKRRLQWNRIAIYLTPEVFLEPEITERLSSQLAPATRNLGLEKVVVRLKLLDREAPDAPATESEIVISNVTGLSMTILAREPRRSVLQPHSAYERKVVEARRRRLVYPYEIIRMLTGSGRASSGVDPELRPARRRLRRVRPGGGGRRPAGPPCRWRAATTARTAPASSSA